MRSRALFFGLCALVAATHSQPAAAGFADATATAGLAGYVQHVRNAAADCILGPFICPERMTGGAAVADVDGDGDPDLFVTRLDAPDLLFENQGGGTFVDVSAASGLAAFDLQSNGATFADIDNDGDPDLYVTTYGAAGDPINDRHYLFLNDGTGVFTEDAVARGADVTSAFARLGWSVGVGDYDRDGWLDLFVGEWRPDGLAVGAETHARLLRNLGAASPGHFEDTTVAAGVDLGTVTVFPDGVYAFAPAFVDLDGDGWQDLVIASDFGTSRLYWNRGDGTFVDGTALARVGTDENGMGSTFGDIDADGDLDWFITSIWDPAATCETESCNWGYTGNRLFRNDGDRRFSDATDVYQVRQGDWGWGAAFFDADNDGDLDLTMTNGVDFPDAASAPFLTDPMRFWRNEGPEAPMTEMAFSEGITDTASGKGLLVFDADSDGDEDVFVVNNAGAPVYYENLTGNTLGWLRVALEGVTSNRDGMGARIVVTPVTGGPEQVRVVGAGHHFLSGGPLVAHFGLGSGAAPLDEVRIEWPSSRVSVLNAVARNQVVSVVEPATSPCDDGFDNDGDGTIDFPQDPGCTSLADEWEQDPALPCDDGLDGDGDGLADFPEDPGCSASGDASEREVGLPCDDGVDGDGDGLIDYPEDPGCAEPAASLEDPACQDGLDNDAAYGIDFDGGAAANGGVPLGPADPHCENRPWRNRETGACGLGFELGILLPALWVLRRRRQRAG